MRVAYLCADRGVPVAGTKGASIHLRAVARALTQRGHDVTVLAASSADSDDLPFPVRDIGFDRLLKRLRKDLGKRTGSKSLAAEIHGLLLNRRARLELDRVHAERPLDAVYERYSLWSWEGVRFARAHELPLILEVNAPLVVEQQAYRGLELAAAATGIAEEVIRGASAVVVPSAELLGYITDQCGRRGLTEVLPNGVDVDLFRRPHGTPHAAPEPAPPPSPADFVIAFLGTLKPWHGIDTLIEGFEALLEHCPAAQLLVIGDGPLRPTVEAARDRLGASRIHLTGAIDHEQVPFWLARADVGVAPYPRLEQFYFSPLKVIEYMAAGLPVVASRVGQLRETVRHGESGLLVEPQNPGALAAALADLAGDEDLRRRMGSHGRRRAFAHHGWDRVAQRIEALASRLLEAAVSEPSTGVSRWA